MREKVRDREGGREKQSVCVCVRERESEREYSDLCRRHTLVRRVTLLESTCRPQTRKLTTTPKRIFLELMTSDRKLKVSREGSK